MSSFDTLGNDLQFAGFRGVGLRPELVAGVTPPAHAVGDSGRFIQLSNGDHYVSDGTRWVPLNARLETNIPISALATNPLDRANHTGTQLANTISNFDTQVRTNRLDQLAAPTAPVNLNGQQIANAPVATAAGQLVEFSQLQTALDQAKNGVSVKDPVVTKNTAGTNVPVSGIPLAVDMGGVTTVAGSRVLLTSNTNPAENRIWIVQAGAWTLPADVDNTQVSGKNKVTDGTQVLVQEGTFAGTQWVQTTNEPIVLGTTGLSWSQSNAGSAYTGSQGVELVGSDFRARLADATLLQTASGLSVNPALVARYFEQTIGGATIFVVTHNLNRLAPLVSVYRLSDGRSLGVRVEVIDANSVRVTFGAAIAAASHRVGVVG